MALARVRSFAAVPGHPAEARTPPGDLRAGRIACADASVLVTVSSSAKAGHSGALGRGVARVQGKADQRRAAEQHVDADEESERPRRRVRQAGEEDGRQKEVDYSAE